MSLDIEKIKKIVNSEKNAGEFAILIREFKKIGIKKYEYLVEEGLYKFYDNLTVISIELNGVPKKVDTKESKEKIKAAVLKAQARQIDFVTFAELAANAGVSYWNSDLVEMKVNYYGNSGSLLLSEPIPQV